MKKTNKILSIILAVLTIMSILIMPVNAKADSYSNSPIITVSADSTYIRVGDTVQVDVYISENSNLGVLTADLVYNADVFEAISIETTDLLPGSTSLHYDNGRTRYQGATAGYVTEGGIVFTVTLRAISEADYSGIYVDVIEVCDKDFNFVHVDVINAFVEVYNDYTFDIVIVEPSQKSIRYKDGIILDYTYENAEYGEIPCVTRIEWEWDNDNFDVTVNADNSITIISKKNGYTTFKIYMYDMTNSLISVDTIEMQSKAGFFQRIGGFFRSIFGLTEIYPY